LIPQSLSEWNYEKIKELTDKDYLEADTFEFKLKIKSRDPKLNDRVVETTCAFANTAGGFIIFGINDMGNRKEERIVGLQKSDDLSKEFGDKIKSINPTPYYDFVNPLIQIPGKNTVLFVAQIPKSSDRPHMKADTGRFYSRTNKGNEIMNYQQVKEAFLRYEERRSKLSLLYIELFSNSKIADEVLRISNKKIDDGINGKERFLPYSPLKFEITAISTLLPEVYSIIQNDSQMTELLLRLRLQLGTINSEISMYHSLDPDRMEFQSDTHNEYIKKYIAEYSLPLMNKIMKILESRYGLVNPFPDSQFEIFKKI
jgi:Putative DNA-binding domain